MGQSDVARLRAWAESVNKEARDRIDRIAAMRTDGVEGEAHAAYENELSGLTDSEAIKRLRSADESHVAEAYLILSERLKPDVLADVCWDCCCGTEKGRD